MSRGECAAAVRASETLHVGSTLERRRARPVAKQRLVKHLWPAAPGRPCGPRRARAAGRDSDGREAEAWRGGQISGQDRPTAQFKTNWKLQPINN